MPKQRIEIVGRRDVLIGAAAALALTALLGSGRAGAQDVAASGRLEEALSKILGTARPTQARMSLELPEIAESGNTVPYAILVDSPMTEQDYVRAVHVLAGANPLPSIASFFFTPASGKAQVGSRMRLARSQDVLAVAELSDGQFLIGRRSVKVTIGGCGG